MGVNQCLGVSRRRFRQGAAPSTTVSWTVEALQLEEGRVASAAARDDADRVATITADWFICSMPVDRAAKLLSPEVVAAAPALAPLHRLRAEWMNGVMFYLRHPTPVTHGHASTSTPPGR